MEPPTGNLSFLPLQKKSLKLLIIDNYDSFTFNLVQRVEEAGEKDYFILKNDQLDAVQANDFEGVLISPGPGIAQEAGQLVPFLQKFYTRKKMLGICLGFEALVELFGGKLSLLDFPLHGVQNKGTIIQSNLLFQKIDAPFLMGHYHSWYVAPDDFPEVLEISVKDEQGLIMGFRHKKYPLFGLQFHPESYMTPQGGSMLKNWLQTL